MKTAFLFLRALTFQILFLIWALIVPVALIWVLVLPKRPLLWVVRTWQAGAACLAHALLGITFDIQNKSLVPEGACIIAAKHQSMAETFILNILFDNPAIVLKEELTRVPIWGWFAKRLKLIPIDRGAGGKSLIKMMAAAKAAKEDGRKIVLFPQGTRVLPGVKKPYKVGVAALYQQLKIPVVPMALNSGLLWPKGRFLKKPGVVTIRFLDPIPAGLSRAEMLRRLEATLEAESDKLANAAAEG